jgi:hypothetical protein
MVVFQMKKILIILTAFLLALVAAELIIDKVVGYPKKVGQRKFVYATHIYNNEVLKWKDAFTKYWTVEGNNKVYSYNNLGFPGADVNINDSSKFIFMLGDSFLEALQVPPGKMAVSVFGDLLKNTNFKPVNLGSSNNDPYILWFRTNFYEKYYKPEYVCLFVTCFEILDLNFQTHKKSFDFTIPENFGKPIVDSRTERFANIFRNNSALMNLVANGSGFFNVNPRATHLIPDSTWKVDYSKDVERLKECLKKYKEKYGERFFVVSMEPEEENNKLLSAACDTLGIKYSRKNLLTEENILHGGSHLNELGNQKLGELFYDAFVKFYKK